MNLTNLQKLWINLGQSKKCIWCGQKWNESIIRKYPEARDAICLFKPDYLAHCQQTHGYTPEDIDMFIDILTTNDGLNNWNKFLSINNNY